MTDYISEAEAKKITRDALREQKLETATAMKKVMAVMNAQHALHGLLAECLNDMGGKKFIKKAAKRDPMGFLRLVVHSTPNLMPTSGVQGDINLLVDAKLVRTELDD